MNKSIKKSTIRRKSIRRVRRKSVRRKSIKKRKYDGTKCKYCSFSGDETELKHVNKVYIRFYITFVI